MSFSVRGHELCELQSCVSRNGCIFQASVSQLVTQWNYFGFDDNIP